MALQDAPLPQLETALNNMIAGLLTNKSQHCSTAYLAHINPLEKNFEETTATLVYLEKIKSSISMDVKKSSEGAFAEHVEAIETMLGLAEGEQDDLKRMHEEQLLEENEEFAELEKKLGLDYPVNEILKA